MEASFSERLCALLEHQFRIEERGSNVWQEVRAGTSGFLTMSPILLLNPHVLSSSDLIPHEVAIATALSSAFASFLCGLTSNLPLGLAPGLGLSAYFSYGMVSANGMPLSEALNTCFYAGLVVLLLTITRFAKFLMKAIPNPIKTSTIIGMGLLLTIIAFESSSIVVRDKESYLKLGNIGSMNVWVSMISLVIIAALEMHKVQGGIIIGVVSTSLLWFLITSDWPSSVASLPSLRALQWPETFSVRMIPGLIGFVSIGLFDVAGVVSGMVQLAGIPVLDDESIPGSNWAFASTSLGTMLAALLGSSPIIVHIESGAAISSGGRTGLTSIVIGCWFLCSVFFAPLLGSVPASAVSPALLLLASSMMSLAHNIKWTEIEEGVPAFLCLSLMPFTFSITNGIFAGVILYLLLKLLKGDWVSRLRSHQPIITSYEEDQGSLYEPLQQVPPYPH